LLIAIVLGAWLLITLFAIALMRAAARADALPTERPIDLAQYRLTHPVRATTRGHRHRAAF
jgi:hypothetical protein